ncbi:nitrite reductase small subunit NirD [Asticcacaulis sp. EMRT-3]|uniref:nitrite reductase small subunit NirD n=1 Tax=Asticcacaulis sp. EMRT-3 TaxID=3040349 RepID=UPI0024AF3D15|nr:nitrite reductase small subunit NirD [Asticcacaulis sp. EMRT-3]MDI7775717.1 nitrite reductase small subunit NirD [Asticcacaulis sp. EMRT-3]
MNAISLMNWVDVGHTSDIPHQGARRIETDMGAIAVFCTVDHEYYAVMDKCPHKGGPLSEGIVHGRSIACPLHNWSISLQSGEAQGVDAGKGCAPPVPLKVENGQIFLSLPV